MKGEPHRRRAPLTAASYRYFLRGQSLPPSADDYRVRAQRRVKLAPFDRYLRKFHYQDALDAALATVKPEVVASVLQELTTRSGLNAALGACSGFWPAARVGDVLGLLTAAIFQVMRYARHGDLIGPSTTSLDIQQRLAAVGHRLIVSTQEVGMRSRLRRSSRTWRSTWWSRAMRSS